MVLDIERFLLSKSHSLIVLASCTTEKFHQKYHKKFCRENKVNNSQLSRLKSHQHHFRQEYNSD